MYLASETLKSTGVKKGCIKVDDNKEKDRVFWKKKQQQQHWLFPVISGRFGHKWIPIYGVPFLY